MEHVAYIAFGSNLGDREATIQEAAARLDDPEGGIAVERVSSLYETAPIDCPIGSPPFVNAAVSVTTRLSARSLFDRLKEIERQLGRIRAPEARNAPRRIDLDLLLYDDLVLDEPDLVLPHPRMHQRRFVLEPLAEIAPSAVHPVLKQTVTELLQALR